MPRLPYKQLKRLPVQTKSGKTLGRVRDIVIETEGQLVAQYLVAPTALSSKTYLIGRDQIIAIQAAAIIVADSAVTENSRNPLQQKSDSMRPEAIAMREET